MVFYDPILSQFCVRSAFELHVIEIVTETTMSTFSLQTDKMYLIKLRFHPQNSIFCSCTKTPQESFNYLKYAGKYGHKFQKFASEMHRTR